MASFRFGDFQLDPGNGDLRKSGVRVKLPPQPFQVLALLVSRRGQLVTREQIQEEVWGHNSVHLDQGINSSISHIRSVLGDVAETPRYIETVPRRGYRFIAPVETVDAMSLDQATRPVAALSSRQRSVLRGVLTTLVVLIAAVAMYSAWRELRAPFNLEPDRIVLAALPFRNLDGGDDYFSDGLTEEIITHLGRLDPTRLRVIAPTSAMTYKNAGKTVEQIASQLGADYILEGGVRRFGDRARISVQLTDAQEQVQLWSTTYDRHLGDVLDVQSELARRVTRSLALELMPGQAALLARASTTNPAAYTAYLKGGYHLSRLTESDIRASLLYFEEAIDKDPGYALAHVRLADCYIMLGVHNWVPREVASREASKASLRALSLDDTLGEAYASLGLAKYWFEWDWLGAEREFQRALELTPNYSTAHHRYGALLGDMGRLDEALEQGRLAQELDPRAPDVNLLVATHLYHARRYDEALAQAREIVKMDPDFIKTHRLLGQIYVQKRMFKHAVREYEMAVHLSGGHRSYVAGLGYAYGAAGREGDAHRVLEELMAPSTTSSPFDIALVYIGLRDTESSLDWLERAFEERQNSLLGLQVEPLFDDIRATQRFRALIERLHFPPVDYLEHPLDVQAGAPELLGCHEPCSSLDARRQVTNLSQRAWSFPPVQKTAISSTRIC